MYNSTTDCRGFDSDFKSSSVVTLHRLHAQVQMSIHLKTCMQTAQIVWDDECVCACHLQILAHHEFNSNISSCRTSTESQTRPMSAAAKDSQLHLSRNHHFDDSMTFHFAFKMQPSIVLLCMSRPNWVSGRRHLQNAHSIPKDHNFEQHKIRRSILYTVYRTRAWKSLRFYTKASSKPLRKNPLTSKKTKSESTKNGGFKYRVRRHSICPRLLLLIEELLAIFESNVSTA